MHPAAARPEIAPEAVTVLHVHVRLGDPLVLQRLQAMLDQAAGDTLLPQPRRDREVLNVTTPAVVPCHQAADDGALLLGDEAEPGIAPQVSVQALDRIGDDRKLESGETCRVAVRIEHEMRHLRTQALYHLGRCFAKKRIHDLAVRTLENALKEKVVFDDEKKEIVYALAEVLESTGRGEEAIEHFKSIYEVDINYRDVADKIDAYYAEQ